MAPEKEKNGEKLQTISTDIFRMIFEAYQSVSFEAAFFAMSGYSHGIFGEDCPDRMGMLKSDQAAYRRGLGALGGGATARENAIETAKNEREGRKGSGNNGATATLEFNWKGKPVYVKYNPDKISAGDVQEKITRTLEDIALADREGVIAGMPDFCFDLSMSAEELANGWKQPGCDYAPDILGGFSSNNWVYDVLDDDNNPDGCSLDWTSPGWIYIANDYIHGSADRLMQLKKGYWFYAQNGNDDPQNFAKSFLMIMAHEIKHGYDALYQYEKYNSYSIFHAEGSANGFMNQIWNYYNPGWEIIKGKR
jgi:hypothetical protein